MNRTCSTRRASDFSGNVQIRAAGCGIKRILKGVCASPAYAGVAVRPHSFYLTTVVVIFHIVKGHTRGRRKAPDPPFPQIGGRSGTIDLIDCPVVSMIQQKRWWGKRIVRLSQGAFVSSRPAFVHISKAVAEVQTVPGRLLDVKSRLPAESGRPVLYICCTIARVRPIGLRRVMRSRRQVFAVNDLSYRNGRMRRTLPGRRDVVAAAAFLH